MQIFYCIPDWTFEDQNPLALKEQEKIDRSLCHVKPKIDSNKF